MPRLQLSKNRSLRSLAVVPRAPWPAPARDRAKDLLSTDASASPASETSFGLGCVHRRIGPKPKEQKECRGVRRPNQLAEKNQTIGICPLQVVDENHQAQALCEARQEPPQSGKHMASLLLRISEGYRHSIVIGQRRGRFVRAALDLAATGAPPACPAEVSSAPRPKHFEGYRPCTHAGNGAPPYAPRREPHASIDTNANGFSSLGPRADAVPVRLRTHMTRGSLLRRHVRGGACHGDPGIGFTWQRQRFRRKTEIEEHDPPLAGNEAVRRFYVSMHPSSRMDRTEPPRQLSERGAQAPWIKSPNRRIGGLVPTCKRVGLPEKGRVRSPQ